MSDTTQRYYWQIPLIYWEWIPKRLYLKFDRCNPDWIIRRLDEAANNMDIIGNI